MAISLIRFSIEPQGIFWKAALPKKTGHRKVVFLSFSIFFFHFFDVFLRNLSCKRIPSKKKFLPGNLFSSQPRRHFRDLENACRSNLGECLRSGMPLVIPRLSFASNFEFTKWRDLHFLSLGFKYLAQEQQSISVRNSKIFFFDNARVSVIATSVELFA